jgi:hypothetical protein
MLSSHLKFTEKLQEIRNIDLAGASVPDSKTNLHNYTDSWDFGRRGGGGRKTPSNVEENNKRH